MKMVRAFGASVLLASGLFATSQGCALFTCIEDDCAQVSSSNGGNGVGGNDAPTASASITATDVTSTGVGGEGGNAPCPDCPVCSAELDGPALSVTVLADNAYALVELPGESAVFELGIEPGGFGDPSLLPGGSHPAGGRLVGTNTSVFHVSENLFQDVFSGEGCDTSHTIIGASAAGSEIFFLSPDGVRTFTNCDESVPDGAFAGAPSIAASPSRIAFHGVRLEAGPCFKALPLVLSSSVECLAGQKPLAVSLVPSGKRILFRDISHVYSWEADSSASAEIVADFEGDEEVGLPIAATTTEVFFARSTATKTMWRCRIDPPYECRSAETEAVSSIHVDPVSETAHFAMGKRVCKWP